MRKYIDSYDKPYRKKYDQYQDFFSMDALDLQEWVDDGILEIEGDISVLYDYNIDFSKLLMLAGYYHPALKTAFNKVCISAFSFDKIKVSLETLEFSSLAVLLDFSGLLLGQGASSVTLYSCVLSPSFENKDGIVFRGFVNQVLLAKQLGFQYLIGTAGGDAAEYQRMAGVYNRGYFYRPMLGFFHYEEDAVVNRQLKKLLRKAPAALKKCRTLNELLRLRDAEGERIGLAFWKQVGIPFSMIFDLADESESMSILREYVAKKQYEKPEKYGDMFFGSG